LTLDELMSRPIIGGCLRPNSVSRKLTASFFQRQKQRAGLLISYFDASSKAFDFQRQTRGWRPVRVANLTREGSASCVFLQRVFEPSIASLIGPSDMPAKGCKPGFYNAIALTERV
jgi:hypothetical protein